MSKNSLDKKLNFKKEANDIIARFYNSLENFSTKKNHELYEDFWHLRADLEILIVEIQHSLDFGSNLQRWQKNYFEELRGTRSKTKAKKKLDDFKDILTNLPDCSSDKLNECYKILWKLKETIASVLSAFPAEKYKWIDGEFKKEDEKIFEI